MDTIVNQAFFRRQGLNPLTCRYPAATPGGYLGLSAAEPSKTGLTMRGIAIGTYGEFPDHAPLRTMAPRGSDI
ncbi:MAG TPA: hypothetical protein VII19_01025, partial [Acidimicrobiales bacterium]